MKINQFHRQNPAQWLNNLAQMKQKSVPNANRCGVGRGGFRNPMPMGPDMMNHGAGVPPAGMNMPPRLPMWSQQVFEY